MRLPNMMTRFDHGGPVVNGHRPFFSCALDGEVAHFEHRVIVIIGTKQSCTCSLNLRCLLVDATTRI